METMIEDCAGDGKTIPGKIGRRAGIQDFSGPAQVK